jgi:copper chaperone
MALEFTVPNLACSACVETVTKAVKAIDASAEISADPKTKQVSVVTTMPEAAVQEAIIAAGYTVA